MSTNLQSSQRPTGYFLAHGFGDRQFSQTTREPQLQKQAQENDENAPQKESFSILRKLQSAPAQGTPQIQAAFEPAYVNDTAHLHKIAGGKDKGTIPNTGVKAGDEVQVDTAQHIDDKQGNPEWYMAKVNGMQGYLRISKVVLASLIENQQKQVSDPKLKSDSLGTAKSRIDGVGKGGVKVVTSGFDVVSSGITLDNPGVRNDRGVAIKGDVVGSQRGYGRYPGIGLSGLEGLTGMIETIKNAKAIRSEEGAWNRFAAGYDFITSLSSVFSSAAQISNAGYAINEGRFILPPRPNAPLDQSSAAGIANMSGSITEGLRGLKSAAEGLIGFYKLFKSQSDQKVKDVVVTLKSFTDAAQNAARIARNTYELLGKAVPPALLRTVPVLGIAMSVINILIRFYDALIGGRRKREMIEESNKYCQELAALVGEPLPDTTNVENSKLFVADRRGTFPAYKTYFRVKADLRDKFYALGDRAKSDSSTLQNKGNTYLGNYNDKISKDKKVQIAREKVKRAYQENNFKTGSYILKKAQEALRAAQKEQEEAVVTLRNSRQELINAFSLFNSDDIDNVFNVLDDKQSLKITLAHILKIRSGKFEPQDVAFTDLEAMLKHPIEASQSMRGYEYVDKMSEINQKREVGGSTDIILELINMTADIVTLGTAASGVGPAIAQGLKALTGGYKAAHGVSKFTQKLYRDNKDTERSTENKHKEYVNHAKFIYGQYANLDTENPEMEEIMRLEKYVRATGVNYGLWLAARFNPDEQVKMLVNAMKQR